MKKIQTLLYLLAFWAGALTAQTGNVGIGTTTPDSSAALDIRASDKGLLLPRLTTAERDAIANPAPGLIIYNTTDSCFNYYTGEDWYKDCGRSLTADEVPAVRLSGGGSSLAHGNGIATDAAGNIFVTGFFFDMASFGGDTLISNGSMNMFTVKYDAAGNVLWARQGGGDFQDKGTDIAADAAGNVFVTGIFQGTATFGGYTLIGAGGEDIFTVKYDADGNVLWAQQSGGTSADNGEGITTDAAGNVFVTGIFQGTTSFGDSTLTSRGGTDVFIVKYDADGNVLWAQQGGGTGLDWGQDITTDEAGNVFVTGSFQATATFGSSTLISVAGHSDVFTAKYDSGGNLLWVQQGGGINFDQGYGIAADAAGNVFITGSFDGTASFSGSVLSGAGGFDVFTVKYDPDGNMLWVQQGGGTGYDQSYGIVADAAGNVFATGRFDGTATFGGYTLASAGNADVFTVKYDAAGNLLWAQKGGGPSNDYGEGVAGNEAGNIFITGFFQGLSTFGSSVLADAGSGDVFVVQYSASGGQSIPNSNLSSSQDNDTDPANELITSATLNGNTLEITDAGGTQTVDLSALNVDDADSDPTNELITSAALNGSTLEITDAGGTQSVDLSTLNVNDADPDPANELITSAALNGNTLEITDAGGTQTVDLSSLADADTSAVIADADNDTKVEVEQNPDEDVIRFSLGGTERWVMAGARLENRNSGGSVFIGEGAGASDDGSNNYNVAIGYQALFSNTTGYNNTANGHQALTSNTTGNFNTANGKSALFYNTNGSANTANGFYALFSNTTGYNNTANGSNALSSNTTGIFNTANGSNALTSNTTGNFNTATGYLALTSNTTGAYNTANGSQALHSNSSGLENTANGYRTLYSNTTGRQNTASGYGALYSNTTGIFNTANGYKALYSDTTGHYNTANGSFALFSNTTGNSNTATGFAVLSNNSSGEGNTAIGHSALSENTEGNHNTAIGLAALSNNNSGDDNTAVGSFSLYSDTTGSVNTALGIYADVTMGNLTNATVIGSFATVSTSNKVRIGNTSVTVIEGQVDWSFPSDARFKFNVDDSAVPGLALIDKLRPVTYQFDARKYDEHLMQNMPDSLRQRRLSGTGGYDRSSARVQTGFLAQEVEQACKELGYDFSGLHVPENETDNYGLAYGSFVPLLVKAVQELSGQVGGQQEIIEQQRGQIRELESRLGEVSELKQRLARLEAALLQSDRATEKRDE